MFWLVERGASAFARKSASGGDVRAGIWEMGVLGRL